MYFCSHNSFRCVDRCDALAYITEICDFKSNIRISSKSVLPITQQKLVVHIMFCISVIYYILPKSLHLKLSLIVL